ncbi:MAG: hypothetical protein MJB14_07475, partial [Spirochaetes bacterium]|nr:hypothetical protein [Spirochaetota bacterium]
YMPKHTVRFASTLNLRKYLVIDKNSPVFTGRLKISANSGQEKTFKVKFASFDEEDNIIAESDYYYFKIDKKKPVQDIIAEGIDFTIDHNEQQVLKLKPPQTSDKVFYKLNPQDDWILYEDPIVFNPPIMGRYKVNIYAKSEDSAGNQRINKDPFTLKFDRRGLFVDTNQRYSGNGTESNPTNSIERAIAFATEKNIKIIYLISDIIELSHPHTINSDIIIQPYQVDNTPSIKLDNRSIWKKNHIWFTINRKGFLEFRNINFHISSGNTFIKVQAAKCKCYNLNILFTGTNDFTLYQTNNGKLGVNNFSINAINNPSNFSFIKSVQSTNFLKNIKSNITTKKLTFANLQNTKNFQISNLQLTCDTEEDLSLIYANRSQLKLNQFTVYHDGTFKKANLFQLKSSKLSLSESQFTLKAKDAFEISLLDQYLSNSDIASSVFKVNQGNSVIGFNSYGGNLAFHQSMVDIQNINDYIYSFRMEKSKLSFNSSIIRNLNADNAVSFLLNYSTFEGTNNSVFNINIKSRGFNFWVNEKANLTTINSFYYFDQRKKNNSFIYLNNPDYDAINPVWYSNAITSDIITMENLNVADAELFIKDFTDKNIYYDFEDNFDLEADDFFLFRSDSPLLQGGIDQMKSPIKIYQFDFFGNSRILQGYGIDIGAVQRSGYLTNNE